MSYRGKNSVPGVSSVQRGTQLSGIYEIDSLIAAGGMAEVYLGHNIQTGDPVAIKIVLPEFAVDEMILDLLRKEARILFHLFHDAIVRYYVFTVDPVLHCAYLAMEYVSGVSLLQRIQTGPLTLEEVVLLKTRLADGLQKAHDAGVIHRDVSPDNILMPDNKVERAKIIDFSIARTTAIGGTTILGGSFAGKYNFVSPEQLGMFAAEVSPRSDIYSLGLVLAAALRGEPLDMNGTQVEVIDKRRHVPKLDGIDTRMHGLLRAMLNPDPAGRLPTMAAVRDWRIETGRREARPPDAASPARPRPANPIPRSAPAKPPPAPGRKMALASVLAVLFTIAAGAGGGWYYVEHYSKPLQRPPVPTDVNPPATQEPNAGTPAIKIDAAAKILSFIREYQGGECFFASALSVADDRADIAIYALTEEPAKRFVEAFTTKTGIDPKTAVHLTSARQCPAINTVRMLSKADVSAPRIALGKQSLRPGDPLDVRVSAASGMQIDVLLIDHNGIAYKFKTQAKSASASYEFNIKGIRVEPGVNPSAKIPWLVLGFSSPEALMPLNGLSFKDFTPVEQLMPKIQKEALQIKDVTAAIGYFEYFHTGG